MKHKDFVNEFNRKHGCLDSVDFKDHSFNVSDGSLFCIDTRKMRLHKIAGYKKFPDGMMQIVFSKHLRKKPSLFYSANFCFEELGDTIRWFKAIKTKLEKLGYKTDWRKNGGKSS